MHTVSVKIAMALLGLICLSMMGCQGLKLREDVDDLFKTHCRHWEIDTTQLYFKDQTTFSTMLTSSHRLIIRNNAGRITVRPGQWSNVFVKANTYATTETMIDQIEVTSAVEGHLTDSTQTAINVMYGGEGGTFGFTILEVYVPAELRYLDIQSTSAGIEVIDVALAELKITAPCGRVMGQNIDGDVAVWGEHGDILMDCRNGHVDIENTSGNVTLYAVLDNGKTYNVNSRSGDIHFIPRTLIGTILIQTVSGTIDTGNKVQMTDLMGENRELSNENSAGVDVSTSPENTVVRLMTLDMQSKIQEVEGKLGVGSAKTYLQTSTGNIYLH